ncbi:MAG TPA: glycosyltransferase family 9 protein [Chloroflexia bacterium]|nr:glycosyltransferase family 9 protein [Chloroflexia bacterium]
MKAKDAVKNAARQALLWNLQIAARPTLRYRASPANFNEPPKKLLLVRPDHLGDILMLTPALAYLRKALPDTEITALVGPWGKASLQNNPHIDHIVQCEFPGFSRKPKENFLAPYLYALEQSRILRAHEYDAAINFRYDFWWGALLLYLADIPVRVGFRWPEARRFQTHSLALPGETNAGLPGLPVVPFGQTRQHGAAMNLELARYFLELYGLSTPLEESEARLHFYPSAEDERYVRLLLSEWGIGRNERLVAIHPGTGATIKLWTVEGFAALADAIAQRYNARVVLTGSEKEKTLIKNIAKACQIEHLHLNTDGWWGRLAALFERCQLVVGLDSGPLHLAVSSGVPSIHLFGPTDPALFGPWGDPALHRVIRTEIDLPCCPCGVLDFDRTCWKGGYCMRTIKTDQVLRVAEELLK